VNGLDPATVERFRAAARDAAHVLCWEAERKVFEDLHDRLAIMA
jgi:hypothetical protein